MRPMKYFCGELTQEIKERAKNELRETEEIKTKCLYEFKQMIKEEPDFFPCNEDKFLLRFLRKQKFNVRKAYEMFQKYYKCKARYSGIITDFRVSQCMPILDELHASVLEYRDKNDTGILIMRNAQYDIERFTFDELIGCIVVVGDILLKEETSQVAGYSIIFDLKDFSLRHATHYGPPSGLYRFAMAFQDLIPCRVKGYHVVNEPYYINILFSIVKKFISPKLKKRVYFHGNDLNSLYKYFSPDILPEELGGKQGPLAKYGTHFNSVILSNKDYIDEMIKYGYRGTTLQKIRNSC